MLHALLLRLPFFVLILIWVGKAILWTKPNVRRDLLESQMIGENDHRGL